MLFGVEVLISLGEPGHIQEENGVVIHFTFGYEIADVPLNILPIIKLDQNPKPTASGRNYEFGRIL